MRQLVPSPGIVEDISSKCITFHTSENSESMTEKRFNLLDSPLHDVTAQCIKFSEENRKCYVEHLEKLLTSIVSRMKEDGVFKCLYRNNMYTGSFYENLRISKPDEFDINLIFVLPALCKIVYERNQPGFAKVKIDSLDEFYIQRHKKNAPNLKKILLTWIDKSGYLLRANFMQWMQGVFTKALQSLTKCPLVLEDTEVKPSSSGPAFTLEVTHSVLGYYSIDLVPVFEFSEKDWPPPPVRMLPKNQSCKKWSIVPKPPQGVTDPTFWRMSFYKQEKEIMNNLNGMKHIIKLMKLFREFHLWKFLTSYAIKTMFLWENERQTNNVFWKSGVGKLFVHMLRRLSECLNTRSIPFYWDRELNLLVKVKEDTMKIAHNRIVLVLKHVNAHLNSNPELIKRYFGIASKEVQEVKETISNNDMSLHKVHVPNRQVITVNNNSNILPYSTNNLERTDVTSKNIEEISLVISPENLSTLWSHICKSKEKVCIHFHCKDGCNSENTGQNVEKTPDVIAKILSMILEEQYEINQYLKSLIQKNIEISKELRELREEHIHLRKHLQSNTYEKLTPPPPSVSNLEVLVPFPSHSFKEHNNSLQTDSSDFSVHTQQLKFPATQTLNNAPRNEAFSSGKVTNTKNDEFSDLLEHYKLQNAQKNAQQQSTEDLICF